MILPGSYAISLLLMILSMLCWGSWANTYKLSGEKWRFELFYFDYAFGVMLAALIYAFTFGSFGWDGFSFIDDLRLAGKRQDLLALVAGSVFNLANMLLVAAISIAGMAVAFPVGIGLALVVGVVWNFALKPAGNAVFLFTGAGIIVGAIIVDALAYRSYAAERMIAAARSGKTKTTRIAVSPKGIVLALVSGLLMGSFFPLVEMAKFGENGLGPYAVGAIFALGVLFSTFVFNLFFMNLPVKGEPIDLARYFKGRFKNHALGIVGGMIWYSGAIANFVAASAEGPAKVGPAVSYAIGQGATMISALWGLLVWKEFAGADSKVRTYLALMFILFLCGLGLVSTAPLVGR